MELKTNIACIFALLIFLFLQAIWLIIKQIDCMCFTFFPFSPKLKYLIALSNVFISVHLFAADKVDSTKVYSIPEVTVIEQYRNTEVRSTSPLQILSSKKIEKLNVLQVSDAVKYFSGVSVKDYGGIGGLKTISVRSLGANHTAVSYDGITLTDCQTGQIDIGRFSLDNVDMLSLNNGQSDNIFQPARLFASAAVLNIRTLSPRFDGEKTLNGKASLRVGSFGLFNPAFWIQKKINSKLSAAFSAEWLSANGEYPYLLQYGQSAGDSTSMEIRKNSDVQNYRLEGSIYANFSENESAYIKSYYYSSDRGLPGATILYNESAFTSQRMSDRTFFTQGHYENNFSKTWDFQANAKYNSGYMCYLDTSYLGSTGELRSIYLQKEYYGSASLLFRAFKNLSFSASSDFYINTLSADSYDFSYPTRYSWLSAIAVKYVTNNILATASALSNVVNETVKTGDAANNQRRISPYISISVQPLSDIDLRFRAFYKNIFRLPTFNDLYYLCVGNTNLKPEDANQFNVGFTYSVSSSGWLPLFSVTTDLYHNNVKNKIVAIPNKNNAIWTTVNLGEVSIDGLDFTGETTLYPWKKIGLVLGTSYTYQRALNITDPNDSKTYKHQLPYTPRISGSGKAALETPLLDVSYSVLWSGHRYAGFQNYSENRLPGYVDHNISFSREFNLKKLLLSTNLELLNLLNKNYAIVRYFPMPGRSFRATVSLKF
ncbi:MAG: TonB-dependent receptor [Paludibacter sp.]|nr:TonB-dependent receptor [Paludibacter sp.]